jgi:hypothetical protein
MTGAVAGNACGGRSAFVAVLPAGVVAHECVAALAFAVVGDPAVCASRRVASSVVLSSVLMIVFRP